MALRKWSTNASKVGGKWITYNRNWLIFTEINLLSYKRQANLIDASTDGSPRHSSGESPNSNISTSWSTFAFNTLTLFVFPIAEKLLTESNPVMLWRAGRIRQIHGPRDVAVSWIER